MKVLIFCLLFVINLFYQTNACNLNKDLQLKDSIKNIKEVNIFGNSLTKGLLDISAFDIYKDTLYLINTNKGKLIKVDLKTGNISTNPKLNFILESKLKSKEFAGKISVQPNGYYISFLNKLCFITNDGKLVKVYNNTYFINDFNKINEDIIITSQNSINLINTNGKLLYKVQFELFDSQFIRYNNGICYSPTSEDNITEFRVLNNHTIQTKTYPPIDLTLNIKNPYITYSDENYFLGFPYKDRRNIYMFKKGIKSNVIHKKIALNGLDFTPSNIKIAKEEGNPNFRIGFCNGVHYIIILMNGKLKIMSFTFS